MFCSREESTYNLKNLCIKVSQVFAIQGDPYDCTRYDLERKIVYFSLWEDMRIMLGETKIESITGKELCNSGAVM